MSFCVSLNQFGERGQNMINGVFLEPHSFVLLLGVCVNLGIESSVKLFKPLKFVHEGLQQFLFFLSEFPSQNV